MTDAQINALAGFLWGGVIESLDFHIRNHEIIFYICMRYNSGFQFHELSFFGIHSYYFVNHHRNYRKELYEIGEDCILDFTSVSYMQDILISVTSHEHPSLNCCDLKTRVLVEMFSKELFIDCDGMRIDDNIYLFDNQHHRRKEMISLFTCLRNRMVTMRKDKEKTENKPENYTVSETGKMIMTEKEFHDLTECLCTGTIKSFGISLYQNKIVFHICEHKNNHFTDHELCFLNVSTFYYINDKGKHRNRKHETKEKGYLEFTSVHYEEKIIISMMKKDHPILRECSSEANVCVKMNQKTLLIECTGMSLDGEIHMFYAEEQAESEDHL